MSEFSIERRLMLILHTQDCDYGVQQDADMPEIVELTTMFFGVNESPEVVMAFTRERARAFAHLILEYCGNDENFIG